MLWLCSVSNPHLSSHSQIPRSAPQERPARVAEREALAMQQKNRSYQLLEDSEEEEGDGGAAPGSKRRPEQRKHKKRRKHLRRKQEEASEEENEAEREP